MKSDLMPVEQKALPPENEIRLLPEEVKSLPEKVQELFARLDPKKQNLIFETQIQEPITETIENVNNDKFAELVASVSEEEREKLATHCLTQLLEGTEISRSINSSDFNKIASKVRRFLDIAWSNKGKPLGDIKIYCEGKYDDYYKEKPIVQEKLDKAKVAVEKMEASISKTKKQKRLTERKKAQLNELLEKLRFAKWEVSQLDHVYSNEEADYENNADIESRTIKERYFFQALGTVIQYYDLTDFQVLIHEMFELHVFSYDKKMLESKKYPDDSNYKKVARYRIKLFETAVDAWVKTFNDPQKRRETKIADLDKKTRTMVEYFLELYDSYCKDKAKNRPEDEMIYTVRQMEITLRLFNRL
jgi:hypothetical protein